MLFHNVVIASAGLLTLAAGHAVAQVEFQVIARSGDAAPGLPSGARLGSLQQVPFITEGGDVFFVAPVAGMSGSSLWRGDGSNLELAFDPIGQVPGLDPGVVRGGVLDVDVSPSGTFALRSRMVGPGVDLLTDDVIWRGMGGTIDLIARESDPAPSAGDGVTFRSFLPVLRVNPSGAIAFSAVLQGTGVIRANDVSVWRADPTLQMVVRENDISATDPDLSFQITPAGRVYLELDDAGALTVVARSKRTQGTSFAIGAALWSGEPGMMDVFADFSTGVPGSAASGTRFEYFDLPSSAGGEGTAFLAEFSQFGVPGSRNDGVWRVRDGVLEGVALQGTPAPGVDDGALFGGFVGESSLLPGFNATGDIVFAGTLTGEGVTSENHTGVWADRGEGLELIARAGDPAPGCPDGVVFDYLGWRNDPAINGSGQVAFAGTLRGPGVDSSNRHGVWATDTGGTLRLVVRAGEPFDVSLAGNPSELRVIRSIQFVPDNDRSPMLNDSGQFAFNVMFTDFSTAIVRATVGDPCLADWDASGEPNSSDFLAYLNDWTAQDPEADLAPSGGDGVFDSSDFLAFLAIYTAGC